MGEPCDDHSVINQIIASKTMLYYITYMLVFPTNMVCYIYPAIPFNLANQATASQVQEALATGGGCAAPSPVSPTEVAPSPAEAAQKSMPGESPESTNVTPSSGDESRKDHISNKMDVQSCISIHCLIISIYDRS